MDYHHKYLKYKAKYLKLKMIRYGGGLTDWLWGKSDNNEPKTEVLEHNKTEQCPDLTKEEKSAIELLKKICPNFEIHKSERINQIIKLINESQNFSQVFKDKAIKMLKNRTISGKIQEPRNYMDVTSRKYKSDNGFIIVGKDDIELNMNLSNVTNGYEAYNKVSVIFPGVRIFGLKKTETASSKYLILIRVVNLNDLQKYGDDPSLPQLYDKCENPNIVTNILTEMESCLKDVQFTDIKPKYVVVVYNVRFYIDDDTKQEKPYIGIYLISSPITSLDGLKTNIKIYGNKDKQNYEKYELSIVQKDSFIQKPTKISFGNIENK